MKQLALHPPTSLLSYSPGGRAQQFSFWCFSLCSLFNLQGARPFAFKVKGFVSLLQVSPFVKDFFHPFFTSSPLHLRPLRVAPSATALVEYHLPPLPVKAFFRLCFPFSRRGLFRLSFLPLYPEKHQRSQPRKHGALLPGKEDQTFRLHPLTSTLPYLVNLHVQLYCSYYSNCHRRAI